MQEKYVFSVLIEIENMKLQVSLDNASKLIIQ